MVFQNLFDTNLTVVSSSELIFRSFNDLPVIYFGSGYQDHAIYLFISLKVL